MFTLRFWSDAGTSTTKSVTSLQITSEQCDDKVQQGLSTNLTFEIADSSLFVECLYGDQGACQVYLEKSKILNLNNGTNNTTQRRRLQTVCTNLPIVCEEGWTAGCTKNDDGGCFPAGTMVNTPNGDKLIEELNIGDKVLTVNSYTGKFEYSDIYLHGHKIKNVMMDFVTLYTEKMNLKVSATKDHFIYVCDTDNCGFEQAVLKRFEKVIVNHDWIFDNNMKKYLVIKKEIKEMRGIYNPFTINGNIVVNNIIASCHSDFIFDDLVNNKFDSYLPWIDQMILAPVRWIYSWNPMALKLFDSLYPEGGDDIANGKVGIFDFVQQVIWCISQAS